MSGTTVSGSSVPNNWSGTSGAAPVFASLFTTAPFVTVVSGNGYSSVTGAIEFTSANSTATVSASAVADVSGGSNNLTLADPSTVFGAPNDTISAAGAATLFGSHTGTTSFAFTGDNSSVTGGDGTTIGTSSGANSTLVGGTGNNFFSVTGANSVAVAGPGPGVTGISELGSTGPEEIATNPNGTSGPLVAFLGSGADTVLASGGASTIVGGTGPDVFGFIKSSSGGSEVILNFTKNDTFAFNGVTITSEGVGSFGGLSSDEIQLSDGTSITLVGVDHKLFSS
jgi:hypothetical protein